MSQIVTARVRKGAPMPAALTRYINEPLFEQFKDECIRARSNAEFQNVIQRFSLQNNWQGAVTGIEQNHSDMELIMESLYTLGGLLGAGSTHCDRLLLFNLNALNNRQYQVAPVYQQQIPIYQTQPLVYQQQQQQPMYTQQQPVPSAPNIPNGSIPVATATYVTASAGVDNYTGPVYVATSVPVNKYQ